MVNEKYELLAPVGNFANLRAATEAGADAVYFGLQDFNMRASAKNFKVSDLKKIREICDNGLDGRKVKMFLTLNVIVYDEELKKLESLIKKVKGKVDAIICWDLAVIGLCKKYKIPFHVSTQASVSNSDAAEFYKKLGAERVVFARELSLKQIKKVSKVIFTECFVHGAMCVSISGRCFTSQFQNGKSANRGECLHPCRREYKIIDERGEELKVQCNKVMSAKDLCALPFVEEMKKAGVKSFKIEGRNRPPEYVSKVVGIYRKALDKKLSKKEIEECLEELKKVYNRGFSSGFFLGVPTADDFSDSRTGEQTERKKLVGRVEKYWPKVGVAKIKIFNFGLKLGDEVLVIGDETGLKRVKIESMEVEHKSVSKVEKGGEVGVKMSKVRRGDEVYLVVDK